MLLRFKEAFLWTRSCVANTYTYRCTYMQDKAKQLNALQPERQLLQMCASAHSEGQGMPYLTCNIAPDLLTFHTFQLCLGAHCWAALAAPVWVLVKIHAVITGQVGLEDSFTNTSVNKTKASHLQSQSFFNIWHFLTISDYCNWLHMSKWCYLFYEMQKLGLSE